MEPTLVTSLALAQELIRSSTSDATLGRRCWSSRVAPRARLAQVSLGVRHHRSRASSIFGAWSEDAHFADSHEVTSIGELIRRFRSTAMMRPCSVSCNDPMGLRQRSGRPASGYRSGTLCGTTPSQARTSLIAVNACHSRPTGAAIPVMMCTRVSQPYVRAAKLASVES